MLKLVFIIILVAGAWYGLSELWRKRAVMKAETRLEDADLRNEELTLDGCTTLREQENQGLDEEITISIKDASRNLKEKE